VEWVKAHAQKQRWVEEVVLLKEEMRRMRRYLEWEASVWEGWTEGWPDLRWDITAGVIAYAHRQVHWRRALLQSFSDKWDQSTMDAARAAALTSVQTLSD
jgi:hypothetical protein